jgi:wyosine [tRNA(Phe)-imidazoG37] synthetase (radical SAM superfamily)
MTGFLFDQIVFGPIRSRRMGVSLGVNLLPLHSKSCSFDCIYCECGWTADSPETDEPLPTPGAVAAALESKLKAMSAAGEPSPDVITFAGNGEPTLHPKFAEIINDTISIRDRFAPGTKISVLSNGTRLHLPSVFEALQRVDLNIQKLDGGFAATIIAINQPSGQFNLENLVEQLCRFKGKVIIQTLFLRGTYGGQIIDNTTVEEVNRWISHLKRINPAYVMLYPIDRATPATDLIKLPAQTLHEIAARVENEGIKTKVYS